MREIIIIEDDEDDQNMIKMALSETDIRNKIVVLDNTVSAYEYLLEMKEPPFLIISDINMPGMSGLQLRDKLRDNQDLRHRFLPYVFLTTSSLPKYIWEAYSRCAQGYFIKPSSVTGWKTLISQIITYWSASVTPHHS